MSQASVILTGMTESAETTPQPHLELPLNEARTRLAQLARIAHLTNQVTVITDGGRPIACIASVDRRSPDDRVGSSAAGWVKRIETVRSELRRQHEALADALEQVWQRLDELRPPGSDRDIDLLRAAQTAVRRQR